MNDLMYGVGVDPTELNTGVAAIEAKLEQSGVKFAEAPRKFAKASADAFTETFAAEEKLARFREQTAFDRMTDEEKLTTLRHQALGILDQIHRSEGQSAEKANLQIEYEKKKNQIYDLNQKVAASTATELKNQSAEVTSIQACSARSKLPGRVLRRCLLGWASN